jgi:hypothetical protein
VGLEQKQTLLWQDNPLLFGDSMFDYIRFDVQTVEDGVTYATPDETFTKVADAGLKSILGTAYFFTVYRVDFESSVKEIPSEFRVYGTQGDAGTITSAKAESDSPQVSFDGAEMLLPLDFFGTFSTKEEAVEVMNSGYPVAGCMAPNANNYNPMATLDDGSCSDSPNYTPFIVGGAVLTLIAFMA